MDCPYALHISSAENTRLSAAMKPCSGSPRSPIHQPQCLSAITTWRSGLILRSTALICKYRMIFLSLALTISLLSTLSSPPYPFVNSLRRKWDCLRQRFYIGECKTICRIIQRRLFMHPFFILPPASARFRISCAITANDALCGRALHNNERHALRATLMSKKPTPRKFPHDSVGFLLHYISNSQGAPASSLTLCSFP